MATDFLIRSSRERQAVAAFNRSWPVGTPVRYWTGMREGEGQVSHTIAEARMLGDHTAVVWVAGHGACLALTHVEPIRGAPCSQT